MTGSNSRSGAGLLLGLLLVAVALLALAWRAFCALSLLGSLSWWVRSVWEDDAPGELGDRLRRWLAPRWHYPFVGGGSIVASLAGALAVHEIVSGVDPGLSALVLTGVFLRSISMAWFPWPRTQPAGLRVYPLVALTGPLASALGMIAVWVLVLGGQMLNAGEAHWLALSSVPLAILIVLLATFTGRVGRTLVPSSARSRVLIDDLLTPEAIYRGRERTLACNPLTRPTSGPVVSTAEQGPDSPEPCIHGDRLIPPIGPYERSWMAVRPSLRLNWRLVLALPGGAIVGGGGGLAMVLLYRAGPPLPEAVGLLAAIWVWLRLLVGPLLGTFLYADERCVGEKGLWKWQGGSTLDFDCLVRQRGGEVLLRPTHGSRRPRQPLRLRLRWSREQLAAVAGVASLRTYGVWPTCDEAEHRTWDLEADPVPLPHFHEESQIYVV
ncbi:MAG TPA: hypothetical protein VNH82_10395 [Candidatus Dormibacteraeota bacterium]|nr:hypothetical protein [Candidatus Dormibacteraeota bacterium]